MTKRIDLSDEAGVERAAKAAELRNQRYLEAFRKVLGTPEGRTFIWSLLMVTRVFDSVWDQSSRIHYLAGRQELGQDILRIVLDLSPEAFLLMKQEATEEERQDA